MLKPKFNPAKSETTCRLCVGRIKLAKNKKALQQRQLRKEIAELLRTGKQEYARIRVEAIIRENLLLQAYEILELFLELIAVRSALISQAKEIPRDMVEAISSVIYAAQRVPDLPELTTLRGLLAVKYGKEYMAEASSDVHCSKWQVNEKLKRCLMVEAPANEEKLETLSEIAQEFHVEWDIGAAARDLLPVNTPSYHYEGQMGPTHGMPIPPNYSAHAPPQPPPFSPPLAAYCSDPRPVQYADVHAAVHAANIAAQQAQAAADYAAHLAGQQGYHGGAGPSSLPTHGSLPASQNGSGELAGWLGHPPGTPASDSGTLSPSMPPPTAPAPPNVGGYTVKPEKEVQAAYDNAMGPPTKPNASTGPSAAPPAAPVHPPAPPTPPADPPPATSAKPASNELDELQKRFEALKRL